MPDCLMWGNRVVVPPPGRSNTDGITHPGMSRMKILARSFVRWPGIDQDIEDTVKTCILCQRLNTYHHQHFLKPGNCQLILGLIYT